VTNSLVFATSGMRANGSDSDPEEVILPVILAPLVLPIATDNNSASLNS
jgi:hypothetical protein